MVAERALGEKGPRELQGLWEPEERLAPSCVPVTAPLPSHASALRGCWAGWLEEAPSVSSTAMLCFNSTATRVQNITVTQYDPEGRWHNGFEKGWRCEGAVGSQTGLLGALVTAALVSPQRNARRRLAGSLRPSSRWSTRTRSPTASRPAWPASTPPWTATTASASCSAVAPSASEYPALAPAQALGLPKILTEGQGHGTRSQHLLDASGHKGLGRTGVAKPPGQVQSRPSSCST